MSVNINLAREKGLMIDSDKSKYDEIEKKYKYLLELYISSLIDLKKYDNEIKNNSLYIGKNLKYKNLNEYLDLNYLFFMNNLFIEKLNKDDLLLLDKFDKNNINPNLLGMIGRTYKEVIKDNYHDGKYDDHVHKVCYGSVVPTNFVDNDSLVFRLYYGKNTVNIDGDEFFILHQKQLDFLNEIIKRIINEVKNKMGVKCEILIEKDIW